MVRLAIAQLRPTKGEYAVNVQRIGGALAQVAKLEPPVDLLIFPETATSGYFVEGGVRDVAVTAGTLIRDLTLQHAAAHAPPLDVAVGFYEVFQNHFYNSCLYASLGNASPGNASPGNASPATGIRHVHRKVFLPTYGMFDEERFVERGHEVRAFDTRWGRAAILICEDAWHSLTGTIAALDGAQLIIVPSASPARGTGVDEEGTRLPASIVRWERVVRGIAGEHGVWVALANLVGFEGGKGFPGGSALVNPSGQIVLRGPLFEEAVLTYDVDLDELTRARADSPLLADLEVNLPHLIKNLGGRRTGGGSKQREAVQFDPATNGSSPVSRVPPPVSGVHVIGKGVDEGDPLALDCELARLWLVSFLHDEVVRRRGGLSRADRGRGPAAPRERVRARADDRAVRPLREAQGAADRHQQQVGAAARLFHLARRRHAAGQPARRSLQDAGARARAPGGRARRDPPEAADARPGAGADHRGRLRARVREGGPDPLLSDPRHEGRRGGGARLQRGGSGDGAAAPRVDPLEAPASHRRRHVPDRDRRVLPATGGLLMPKKHPQESETVMSELMMPQHANVMGNVFGGVILALVDRVAAVAAIRHAGRQCVTVSVDKVDFKEPFHVGELVTAYARGD